MWSPELKTLWTVNFLTALCFFGTLLNGNYRPIESHLRCTQSPVSCCSYSPGLSMECTVPDLLSSSCQRIVYTRNYLLSRRRHMVDRPQDIAIIRQAAERYDLGRRLRGRRAGRSRRNVQPRTVHCSSDSRSDSSTLVVNGCMNDEHNQAFYIPVIQSSRKTLSPDPAVAERVNERSLPTMPTRSAVLIDCIVNRTRDSRSVTPTTPLPTFLILNPTSLAKPHAIDQLRVDVDSYSADVVLICETWFKQKHDSNLFAISDHQLHRRDRTGRRGGGICAYTRFDYRATLFNFDNSHIQSDPLFELMWIKFRTTTMDFVLGVCYHPPKPLYNTAELVNKISNDLDYINIHTPDAVIVFAGDLNSLPIDFLTQDFGLTLLNDTVTHGSRVLDKFFCSRPDLFVCRTIASTINTKHKAVIIGSADVVDLVTPIATAGNKIIKRCFDIRAPNIDRLRDSLDNYNWNSLLHEGLQTIL